MRVRFSPKILDDADVFRHLEQIVYGFEEGRHEWHIDDPDAIEQSLWFQSRPNSLRVMFEKAAMMPSPRRSKRLHRAFLLVGVDAPPGSLSPAKAVQFLLRIPLKILMENRFTDGTFVDAIISVLADPEIRRLKDELDALAYDSQGGNGELKKLVEAVHAEAMRKGLPLRVVVLTDSDGGRAGQKSRKAGDIEKTCEQFGIRCVVLRKRSIENYVPDEVIREWRDEPAQTTRRPRIDAFLRLVGEQRDHFPVKDGIKKADLELYTSGIGHPKLSEDDYKELQQGLGPKFIEILFTKDVDGRVRPRPSLTAEALRRRDGAGELDRIVAYIEELL